MSAQLESVAKPMLSMTGKVNKWKCLEQNTAGNQIFLNELNK